MKQTAWRSKTKVCCLPEIPDKGGEVNFNAVSG
jgi:hypothetical protein